MKVLILSIKTGQGHHSTGVAIRDAFEEVGIECRLIDALEHVDPKISKIVSKTYDISVKHAAKASAKLYDLMVKKNQPSTKVAPTNIATTVFAWDLQKYLKAYKPDIIICTHVMSAIIASIMKKKSYTDAIVAGVVTDFTVHPMWQDTHGIDYYVTPSEMLNYQMMKKGIRPGKILPIGIPVGEKFSTKSDKLQAMEQLGLEEGLPTVLIMSGSMGYGNMDKTISSLDKLPLKFQTIVVCGNNEKIFKKLKNKAYKKRFDIYGYVDNVDVMMDAADCIITKPGGITSSEALSKGLPMIMINPIPGHENRNVEFMLNNGIALYANKSFPIDEAVYSLLARPERLKDLRNSIEKYSKRHTAKKLRDFLIERLEEKNNITKEGGWL